eukprot:gnl/TRDRNA2_/TRDRNA2_172063_c0_seq1.p1 gnl/TRDRNA2_/TRDRNA2_172063_c0~~gnl/TRDRNA2_/TRDRNA2_172063_c0_seq1.p1  ORF type:complete len:455 (-),score=47.25 gnl/TRDRNA2_/TRDRNA2_172063_c0_seq1:89-1453(-)
MSMHLLHARLCAVLCAALFMDLASSLRVHSNTSLSSNGITCTTDQKWLHLKCGESTSDSFSAGQTVRNAINAISGLSVTLLPAFKQYTPYRGPVRIQEKLLVDFMGFVIPQKLYCSRAYIHQTTAHALRTRQCDMYQALSARLHKGRQIDKFQTQWPVVAEEYFEYADVLDSVSAYAQNYGKTPNRPYVFVELGAGYGHFTYLAHRALMQKNNAFQHKYLLVDVVSELVSDIENLAQLNNVRYTSGKASPLQFHHGFIGGFAQAADALRTLFTRDWGIEPDFNSKPAAQISLPALFQLYDLPCEVDMVDVDIQGSEYGLFDMQTISFLTTRVRRVHIGTHLKDKPGSSPNNAIIKMFKRNGWKAVWHFDKTGNQGGSSFTQFGPIRFGDGVLSFLNTKPLACTGNGTNLPFNTTKMSETHADANAHILEGEDGPYIISEPVEDRVANKHDSPKV